MRDIAPPPTVMPDPSPRVVQSLSTGFRFAFGERTGAERPDLDDSDWQPVDVPHTWNEDDGVDGDRSYRRGPGYYRLRFRPRAVHDASVGKPRHYLRFGGVSMVATVWLNGHQLGTHWGAHSAFCFDVSEILVPEADNWLVVRADNAFRDDVPPREGDFTMFGGILRAVELIATSTLCIDLLDRAGPGVYLTTPILADEQGVVRARVHLRNAERNAQSATISLTIFDESTAVGTARVECLAAAGLNEIELELTVQRPRRWNGRADPFLYRAVVDVFHAQSLTDRVSLPLGFRKFHFDPEIGFVLNDRPYELRGVNLHEDWEGHGGAVRSANREIDFRLITELGCTFVRLVHYQHDQQAYDLCDRLGLVAWAEHGLVNTVNASAAFAERCSYQLEELIRQSFHHPSIVTWGIGNEVQTDGEGAALLLRTLAAVVSREDATRPSTLATCYDETPGAHGTELIAHNKYFGWYTGTFADFAPWLDAQRQRAPSHCQGLSEYGAGAGPSLHALEPQALDHSEEHQCAFHEAYWRALRARPWVWCKAVWQMFDAAADHRHEGERPGINDKGLVTRDRKTMKDAFYWYRANWSDEPFVYITSRRFIRRPRADVTVKVYSNCTQATLFVNGHQIETRPVDDHVALFGTRLAPGANRIEVRGARGTLEVFDACEWSLVTG